jgi:integrase
MEAAAVLMEIRQRRELLANALDTYITFKQGVRDWKTPNTVKGNVNTLRLFLRVLAKHLGREPLTSDMGDETVIRLIEGLWPDHGTTQTHATSYGRIKTFAKWLLSNQYETGPLFTLVGKSPVVPKVETKFLSQAEAIETFKVVHDYSPKDAHMVWIAFLLARRPAEMGRLRIGDYDPKAKKDSPYGTYTYAETKNHKGRIKVRLTSSQQKAIEAWLEEYRQLMGVSKLASSWYMFPRSVGAGKAEKGERRARRHFPEEPISSVSEVFSRAYKAANVYEYWKAGHSARRGGATYLHDKLEDAGVPDPLQHIQRVLGHGDRRTTAIYIQKEEGARATWEALQKLDDMEQAPQQETDVSVTDESTAYTGETLATVVYPEFGRKRA